MRSTHLNTGKFIKKNKEGVASVVGTIMALLIFLTILGIFVNTWMPVTLKEHERTHMEDVMNEFGAIKGGVDNMVIYTSLSDYPSFSVYQSIDLGADGIPAFASATAGLLSLNPSNTAFSRTYANFTAGSSAQTLSSGGSVEFYAPNRYYVQQWIAYENGAIILKQEDGQIVRAEPSISFLLDASSNAINVNLYQTSIVGERTTASGTQTTGLNMEVVAVNQVTYNPNALEDITITFISKYGPAYFDYLNDTLSDISGITNTGTGWDTIITGGYSYENQDYGQSGIYWKVVLVPLEQYDCYSVTLTLRNDAVSTLSYSKAYVNFEITK